MCPITIYKTDKNEIEKGNAINTIQSQVDELQKKIDQRPEFINKTLEVTSEEVIMPDFIDYGYCVDELVANVFRGGASGKSMDIFIMYAGAAPIKVVTNFALSSNSIFSVPINTIAYANNILTIKVAKAGSESWGNLIFWLIFKLKKVLVI